MSLDSKKLKHAEPFYSVTGIQRTLDLPPCDEAHPDSEARM